MQAGLAMHATEERGQEQTTLTQCPRVGQWRVRASTNGGEATQRANSPQPEKGMTSGEKKFLMLQRREPTLPPLPTISLCRESRTPLRICFCCCNNKRFAHHYYCICAEAHSPHWRYSLPEGGDKDESPRKTPAIASSPTEVQCTLTPKTQLRGGG